MNAVYTKNREREIEYAEKTIIVFSFLIGIITGLAYFILNAPLYLFLLIFFVLESLVFIYYNFFLNRNIDYIDYCKRNMEGSSKIIYLTESLYSQLNQDKIDYLNSIGISVKIKEVNINGNSC